MYSENLEMFEGKESAEDTETRKAYMLAVAIDLGADPEKARININAMFDMAEDLAKLDYFKDPDDLKQDDFETYKRIETIGTWFLPEGKTEFAYNIGVQMLSLMRDGLEGKSFKRPKEMVRIWTLGKDPGLESIRIVGDEK